ncbi:3-oxoacyl-[acyl-carrier-protein] synthase 3 [bacterium HR41]|nr:3-oxoacyl-[acyl-carrier-protein] synthase 3 [bacterium HR41]
MGRFGAVRASVAAPVRVARRRALFARVGGQLRSLGEPEQRPLRSLASARIAGIGCAVPERVLSSAAVAERLGVDERWIVTRTGVRQRHVAAESDTLADLAARAARAALADAELEPGEVDLVVVATMAADELTPNAAPLVADAIGAPGAGAFDVGAACTGFLSALALAAAMVEAGRARQAVVVGADILSRLHDPADRSTAALFADGAGAAVVVPPRAGGAEIGPILLSSEADSERIIRASHDDRFIRMQGHDTFRTAVRRMSEVTLAAAERAGLALDEIDLFVYHQANARILRAVAERLDLDERRVVEAIDRYGNTSSATIPIALCDARRRGLLRSGANVLLAAFGAGFTWGAGVVRWE